MQKMLVDNADRLTIDSVIPVGEAFDDIFTGTTTSSDPQVTLRFKLARDLWAVADQRQPEREGEGEGEGWQDWPPSTGTTPTTSSSAGCSPLGRTPR